MGGMCFVAQPDRGKHGKQQPSGRISEDGMDKIEEFITKNIASELMKIGHSPEKSKTIAESAAATFRREGNFPTGKVFDTLMKQAKKSAGKPPKKEK